MLSINYYRNSSKYEEPLVLRHDQLQISFSFQSTFDRRLNCHFVHNLQEQKCSYVLLKLHTDYRMLQSSDNRAGWYSKLCWLVGWVSRSTTELARQIEDGPSLHPRRASSKIVAHVPQSNTDTPSVRE